jgi:hypothetical protein
VLTESNEASPFWPEWQEVMVRNLTSDAFPAPQHDHAACVDDAIRSAREAFRRHDLSFTPLREKVFREIAGSHNCRRAPFALLNLFCLIVIAGLGFDFGFRDMAASRCGQLEEPAPALLHGKLYRQGEIKPVR